MKKINSDDIHIVSRHSNLNADTAEQLFQTQVYRNKEDWKMFCKRALLTLGVSLTLAGIIFFFAYNWAELHKFVKLGLIEALIIGTTLCSFSKKINPLSRQFVLTAAAVLVGIFFAVYGQIYQTGANAYDFFLAWTLFITLWVILANFPPLWLIYILLINLTFYFYAEQVAVDWSSEVIINSLFIINTIFLICSLLANKMLENSQQVAVIFPNWFTTVLLLSAVSFSTIAAEYIIFSNESNYPIVMLTLIAIFYASGLYYGFKKRNSSYLTLIPLSIIILINSFFIREMDDEIGLLITSAFSIFAVIIVVKSLLGIQKTWKNEE